jgi:prolyl oligopeptidase
MIPYAHVTAGTPYPAVILTVGVNDSRVAPWMSGKMAARLQAATNSGKPVRVRVDPAGGHGVGSTFNQFFAETADVFRFLLEGVRRSGVRGATSSGGAAAAAAPAR